MQGKMTTVLGLAIAALAVYANAAAAQVTQPQAAAPADLLPPTADASRTVSGQWDMAVPKNNLKCRVQLNIGGKPPKATVGMPAPCRKSMGAMGRAELWGLTPTGALRIMAAKGETVAEFSRADAGMLKASVGPNDFTMEPVSGRYPSPDRIASVDAAVQRLNAPQADNPATPATIAGRYKLIRANNTDTGCVLVLDRTQPGPVSQSGKASLEKGCNDKGLLTFDPSGWLVERDRMFLYARKGHRFGFNIERSGQLVKDPAQGSPLTAGKL
jgi:Protease inhibitor Inh